MLRGSFSCVIGAVVSALTLTTSTMARGTPATIEPPAVVSVFPLEQGWITDLGQAPAARPTYDELHAYVPLRDGTLTAVRLIDGETVWTVEGPTPFSPAAGADTVIVAADDGLTALRGSDGAPLWSTTVGSVISAAPLWAQGWLIVVLENGDVVALRGIDGQELWRLSLGGSLLVPPAVGGADLFVPVADGRIVAVDLSTGQQLWEHVLGGSPQEILALDALFVGATDNYFYRLSRRDGHVEWRWRTGGDIVGRASVDRDRVFFLSLDNVLRALDRGSGVQRWRSILRGRPRAGPALVGDLIFVSGVSPEMRTFDAMTGLPSNVFAASGELAAPPYVISQRSEVSPSIVLTIADGHLAGTSTRVGATSVLALLPSPSAPRRAAPACSGRGPPGRIAADADLETSAIRGCRAHTRLHGAGGSGPERLGGGRARGSSRR